MGVANLNQFPRGYFRFYDPFLDQIRMKKVAVSSDLFCTSKRGKFTVNFIYFLKINGHMMVTMTIIIAENAVNSAKNEAEKQPRFNFLWR